MGEIELAFVDCKDCERRQEEQTKAEKEWMIKEFGVLYIGFPVIAKGWSGASLSGKECLPKVPKYCPFCGSQNLDFTHTSPEYFG